MSDKLPLTEEQLIDLYIRRGWSTIKIAKEYGYKTNETVRHRLVLFNIPRRPRGSYKGPKSPEHTAKLKERLSRYNKGLFGAAHPAWKGGRWLDADGYVIVNINGKRWKEHRYVMTQHLERVIEPWEEVNHKNGIRADNRVDNLEVIYSEHKHKDWKRRNGVVA